MIQLIKNAHVYSPSFLGKKDILVGGEKILAIAETKGPKAKKAAFPLPIRMEARKIIMVITTEIPIPPGTKTDGTSF